MLSMRSVSTRRAFVALTLVIAPALLVAQACSPSGSASTGGTGTGGAGGDDTGLGGTLFDADIGDGSLTEDSACAVIEKKAKFVPVTLYIMLDKSTSMSGTKWNAAQAGLSAFVNDPKFEGLKVGIKFFPRDPDAAPGCDSTPYKTPTVPFAALPGNAAAIDAAIAAEAPDGFSTPIYPALSGALLAGIEIEQNNPGEGAAVLLITDGLPQGPATMCGNVNPEDPQVIADLAATGYAYNPPVRTYVVGLPGADQTSANLIAAAGGTEKAVLVGSNNVQAEFVSALSKVAGESLPCEYELPPEVGTGEVSTDKINVQFTPGSGAPETLPQNADCGGDGKGWYYDNPANPSKIVLCDATCGEAKADANGAIQILLGCKTIVVD